MHAIYLIPFKAHAYKVYLLRHFRNRLCSQYDEINHLVLASTLLARATYRYCTYGTYLANVREQRAVSGDKPILTFGTSIVLINLLVLAENLHVFAKVQLFSRRSQYFCKSLRLMSDIGCYM